LLDVVTGEDVVHRRPLAGAALSCSSSPSPPYL
jgi:hypothetical protein